MSATVDQSARDEPREPERSLSAAMDPALYLDPAVVEAEQGAIFERTWQLAGHVADLPAPGRYLTMDVGTQPVLVLRDDAGRLTAFRNVCRHRGSRLLAGTGECPKAIRCRYHGWTYRLDGTLIGVPEGRRIPGLDKPALGLLPVRVEELCGLIFVNLDEDAAPLAQTLDGLATRLTPYQRLVRPMPGLREEDRRVWRYVFIYPNTTIDLYPDQVNTWRLWPDGPGSTGDEWGVFSAPGGTPLTRAVQRINHRLNSRVLEEHSDLVRNVQAGLATRGFRPGPLSRREAGVAWFVDRVRADLGRGYGTGADSEAADRAGARP